MRTRTLSLTLSRTLSLLATRSDDDAEPELEAEAEAERVFCTSRVMLLHVREQIARELCGHHHELDDDAGYDLVFNGAPLSEVQEAVLGVHHVLPEVAIRPRKSPLRSSIAVSSMLPVSTISHALAAFSAHSSRTHRDNETASPSRKLQGELQRAKSERNTPAIQLARQKSLSKVDGGEFDEVAHYPAKEFRMCGIGGGERVKFDCLKDVLVWQKEKRAANACVWIDIERAPMGLFQALGQHLNIPQTAIEEIMNPVVSVERVDVFAPEGYLLINLNSFDATATATSLVKEKKRAVKEANFVTAKDKRTANKQKKNKSVMKRRKQEEKEAKKHEKEKEKEKSVMAKNKVAPGSGSPLLANQSSHDQPRTGSLSFDHDTQLQQQREHSVVHSCDDSLLSAVRMLVTENMIMTIRK
jgi:Mg2+ and Co2+ transporter CorA